MLCRHKTIVAVFTPLLRDVSNPDTFLMMESLKTRGSLGALLTVIQVYHVPRFSEEQPAFNKNTRHQ